MKILFVYLYKLFVLPIAGLLTKRIGGKENIPQKKSFILASNHINSLDYWFIGNTLRGRAKDLNFVAAMDDLKTFIQSGLLYSVSNIIAINRKKEGREGIIKKIVESLRNEKIVVIFPEGDTNRKKELLKGKTGVAEIAIKAGVPVIPLGMGKAKGSFRRIIEIGEPLYFSREQKLLKETEGNQKEYRVLLRKTTDQIMQRISKLCQKPYKY
ncbi:MAG: 1-acyl-sn-glycerol-3-phosphate acyltransferase [Patescibacteria group bacterium]|nr:1-acyl-sn-glycerol-3-phosphate acyltransferase [Patescibacteria group bacterium]